MSPEEPHARPLIRVNGTPRPTAPGATVADLVGEVAGSATGIAVAVNRSVIPRGLWTATELHDGDAVEVLAAVQGG